MIELKNLTAGYFGRPVVEDVTMEIRPGEVLALIGPNGSGKSTLLKAALGLIPVMDGAVCYDGRDQETMKPREIARQSALLSQSRYTPAIQALKLVLHGRFPYLGYPRRYSRADEEIARRSMARTGTAGLAERNVNELSGGQRQGVYLAMALTQDTETVFMDEPTTYLDQKAQLGAIRTARELAREGKAVVLVLHDLSMALGADRVAVLEQGRLAACADPETVYESGILDRVFGVNIHRMDTPHGPRYYCTEKEGG